MQSYDEQLHSLRVFSLSVSGWIEVTDADRVSSQMWTAASILSLHAVILLCGCLCLKMRLPRASTMAFCFHAAGKTGLIQVSLRGFRPLRLTGSKPDSNLLKMHFRRSFFQSNLLLIKWRCGHRVHSVWVGLVQMVALWESHTDSFHKHKAEQLPWEYNEMVSR